MSRSEDAWNARVALAEALNARVITDLKIGASFPTDHPLYVGAAHALTPDSAEVLRAADVILSLDWVDLAGALKLAPALARREDHPGLARLSHPQRLEHGLSGPADRRSFTVCRSGCRRA